MRKLTVERVATPLTLSGAVIVMAGLVFTPLIPLLPAAHSVMLYVMGFGLYCNGVAGNLVSTLRGGEPRSLSQILPLLASSAGAVSAGLLLAGGMRWNVVWPAIALWLAGFILHAAIETRGMPAARRVLVISPWIASLLASLPLALAGGGLGALMGLAVVHVVGLAFSVSVGFLALSYGRPLTLFYVVGLFLLVVGVLAGGFRGVALVFAGGFMVVLSTRFWSAWRRGGGWGFWWAHASSMVGLVASLLVWGGLGFPSGLAVLHAVMLSLGFTVVLGQSIYLAPVIIASRRGPYPPGWVFLITGASGPLRLLEPTVAWVLLSAVVVLVLLFLRPSLRWVWLVVRYGTVEGYARVYRERRL